MAAAPLVDAPHGSAAFFNTHAATDPEALRTCKLSGGGCHFVDLTPGANGTRCGCRRFWTRTSSQGATREQDGWCMCGHHACYHDFTLDSRKDVGDGVVEVEANVLQRSRGDASRVAIGQSSPLSLTHFANLPSYNEFASSLALDLYGQASRCPTNASNTTLVPTQLPDTLAWGRVDHSQPRPALGNALPGGSPCYVSQATSVASSVRTRRISQSSVQRPQISGSADCAKRSSPSQLLMQRASGTEQNTEPLGEHNSLKVVATVGIGTLLPGPTSPQVHQAKEPPRLVYSQILNDLTATVGEQGYRLDKLETASFHEECHDRFENFDLRIAELESRLDEVEKNAAADSSCANVENRHEEDVATASVASSSTNAASYETQTRDIVEELRALKAQVSLFHSYLSSHAHAWTIEVVFLPFPLGRVWQDIHQFKADPSLDGDEWTQLTTTRSSTPRRSMSPYDNGWDLPEHDKEWLLPRACGNASLVDKRLRSRGLIQALTVHGPDHRCVQAAVRSAFVPVFQTMGLSACRSRSLDDGFCKLLGLQHEWVPLRKVHKDSRLRFLSPAEMMTPSLWDVQFLNSVMMRSAEPRLFVTHPDAYLQDAQAFEEGWTWQRIRELARYYPQPAQTHEVPEADALEDHWAWNELLDGAAAAFTPTWPSTKRLERQRSQPLRATPLRRRLQMTRRSSSPALVQRQCPTPTHRRKTTAPKGRFLSVSAGSAARLSPAIETRRVPSHGQADRRGSTPGARLPSQASVRKRRATRSPSYARFTPRWTTSPSPMPPGFLDRPARGTTPFAYTTPHSNAPLQEIPPSRDGRRSWEAQPDRDLHTQDIELSDVDVYESEVEDSFSSTSLLNLASPPRHAPTAAPLPEDEPWPGIEDRDRMSDGEKVDPRRGSAADDNDDDARSEASSQPSEYPSTSRAWPDEEGGCFRIHEDFE